MTFSKKKLPKSQLEIEVEIPSQEFEGFRIRALSALGKEIRMEGFRPGHVPNDIVEKKVEGAQLVNEMAELAVKETYIRILKEEHIDAIGNPNIKVLKLAPGNPFSFQVLMTVLPEIVLPDFRALAAEAERKTVVIEEKEIHDALRWLQESRKQPDGTLPEISDEFAGSVGHFENLESLKVSVVEGLRHEKDAQEIERLRQEILEKISQKCTIEIPELLVEREKLAMLENLKQGVRDMAHMDFAEYLEKLKKTEQELIDSFTKEAGQRVKRYLILKEIAQKEDINPTQEEIVKEANQIIQQYRGVQGVKKDVDGERLKEYTEGVLRHEKTLQFLEAFARKV